MRFGVEGPLGVGEQGLDVTGRSVDLAQQPAGGAERLAAAGRAHLFPGAAVVLAHRLRHVGQVAAAGGRHDGRDPGGHPRVDGRERSAAGGQPVLTEQAP